MSATVCPREEMRALVREAAGPHAPWKVRVARAARVIGLSFSRTKDLYYGAERTRVHADELERARRAVKQNPVGTGTGTPDAEIDRLEAIVARLESVADRLDAQGYRGDAREVRGLALGARDRLGRLGSEA